MDTGQQASRASAFQELRWPADTRELLLKVSKQSVERVYSFVYEILNALRELLGYESHRESWLSLWNAFPREIGLLLFNQSICVYILIHGVSLSLSPFLRQTSPIISSNVSAPETRVNDTFSRESRNFKRNGVLASDFSLLSVEIPSLFEPSRIKRDSAVFISMAKLNRIE